MGMAYLIRHGHGDEIEKRAAAFHRDRFINLFNPNQRRALHEYKIDSRSLRESHIQRRIRKPSASLQKTFADLKSVFAESEEWLHVCHGYGLPVLAEGRATIEETQPDDIIKQLNASYISTTMFGTCQLACNYGDGQTILHFLLPPGTPGFYMGAVDDLIRPVTGENEYILPPGMAFRVVGELKDDANYCKSEDRPWVLPARHIYAMAIPQPKKRAHKA
jgi:hypothetical protein